MCMRNQQSQVRLLHGTIKGKTGAGYWEIVSENEINPLLCRKLAKGRKS